MSANLRLGLIIYGSLDTRSGGYLYDQRLVSHLREQGDHVEIISLPWRSYVQHLADNLSPTLLEKLQQLSLDILLQDELNHPSLFLLNRRLRKQISYPIVSIVHHLRSSEVHPAWQKHIYRRVERQYLAGIDGFIFNSQTTRRAVANCLRTQTSLAPHVVAFPAGDRLAACIDEQSILERAGGTGPLQLLFLGNIISRKGLHTLLGALRRLTTIQGINSWRLQVIGSLDMDRSYVRQMQRLVNQLGFQEKIHFLGVLNDHLLIEQLSSSHVLVVPSSYEGFGIVYLEGMSFGLPAIATSGGAAAEIITSSVDGFIIPAGDEAALSQRLKELICDRQRLQSMSLAARHRFQAQPTWETSMRLARRFLMSLIESTQICQPVEGGI